MLRGNPRTRRRFARNRSRARLPRAGGAKRKLLTFLVLAVVLVALLPTIIAKTSLRNVLISAVMPSDAVRVSIGGASLGWLSGPIVSGVQVNDSAGNTLLNADSISVDRAPVNLLLSSRDLGVIQINRPTIKLKLRPDGSNLEDALQKFLADLSSPTSPASEQPATTAAAPVFAIQIVEGTVIAEDTATGRIWRIEGLNAQYDCHGVAGGLGNGSLSGQIAAANPGSAAPIPAGRFALALKPNGQRNECTLQADGVALGLAQPWLHRFANVTELTGTLSGNGTASWSTNSNSIAADLNTSGTLAIERLDATAPQLAGDRLRLARVELPWKISSQPSGLSVDELDLKCDIAHLAMHGRVDATGLIAAHQNGTAPMPLAGSSDIELRGAVDLARLATMLPRALGIRGDTTITSGSIELVSRLQPTRAGQSLTGSVRTAQLAATSGGKPFQWDQPVSASFAVRRENGQLALDALDCDSKFLRVKAAGTFQQLTANASFDLNSLAEQLGQFIDLSRVELAGTGTAQLNWQQTQKDNFTAVATSDLSQLRIALSDGSVWAEPQLAVKVEAAGLLDPILHQPVRVDSAQLQVSGQGDQLDARLIGAVALSNTDPVWAIAVRSNGSIARWLTRARPWFATGDWKIDGASETTANIRASNNSIDVTETKVVVTNLQAASTGWNINEPRVEFIGDAHFNRATGEIAANSAQLVTSTVSLRTQGVQYASGANGVGQLAGTAAFRADLARLSAWRATTGGRPEYQPAGELTGNIRFAQQAGRITGELAATGQNLMLASTAGPSSGTATQRMSVPVGPNSVLPNAAPRAAIQAIWAEPRVAIRGISNYDAATDRVTFDQLQIESNTLEANIAGSIERLSTTADCNINGALNYDLAQVSPLLRPYLGEGIQLNGREQAKFALAGALSEPTSVQVQPVGYSSPSTLRTPHSPLSWSRRIHAQLELPWSGANVYGLPVGPGKLAAKLGDGTLQIAPIALAVGEGQLNLAPNVRFDPEPAELTMPPGPVLTNVRISPQVSEAMLKYVAPILAGATQSEGQFSLQLEGLRMPLADSKKTDSAGKLTVHAVRVTPGPTTQPFFNLAQQIETLVKRRAPAVDRQPAQLLSISDQQVNFRVIDGRVHHQNIEFQVGDVVMRSQGSVGLDETIALTIQIPVQDAWVTKEPLLAGLKGQSLTVPVTGTLKRPQLDQRAIASLSGQLIQNAAGAAVGGELNKALDKIFKPRQ